MTDALMCFCYQITALAKSCYYHIRELCCIRPYLDFKTASTIAASIVHSKLDYCNSIITSQTVNLTSSNTFKTLAPAVVKAPKSAHITPILKSLHWLKVNERIEYELLSLTYKVLTTAQPSYLHNLISLQPARSTRSSSVVTLSRPPTISALKITDRSFRYAVTSELGDRQSSHPVKTLLQYYGKSLETLPGVAYPGFRDNRSTLNTKTGF